MHQWIAKTFTQPGSGGNNGLKGPPIACSLKAMANAPPEPPDQKHSI